MQTVNTEHKSNTIISKDVKKSIESLLRGESSAIDAYLQVMEKLNTKPEKHRLMEFMEDHRIAVEYWEKTGVTSANSDPKDPGIWGDFVEAVVGSAKLFGNTAALKALKEGEEHGLREYRDFLKNEEASTSHKNFVREVLIPSGERHITSIDAMMKMQ